MKKKIYIAGKLNDLAIGYIKNCHNMIKKADQIRRLGFSVYIPALDLLSGLICGDYEYQDYFENNLPWMKEADAIYVMPNSESSSGTQAELDIARMLCIPIFEDIKELVKWGK
jgi:hypothetical protein